jgi:hypothetical protein
VLTATAPPADEDARAELYAQAWGMVRFLYARDAAAFRRYLATLALRPAGRRPDAALRQEFVQAFGSLETVAADWRAFVARLDTGSENETSGAHP